MAFEDGVTVLHWLPSEDRWEIIAWEDWSAFRAIDKPHKALPGVNGGIHFFIVRVHEGDETFNLIPHKYLIDPDGRIGHDNFGGLTRQEREDYSRLMVKIEYEQGDQERIDEIRDKMGRDVYLPPRESLAALKRMLPKVPQPNRPAADLLRRLESD
jgi:hypothetical protein